MDFRRKSKVLVWIFCKKHKFKTAYLFFNYAINTINHTNLSIKRKRMAHNDILFCVKKTFRSKNNVILYFWIGL